MISIGIVSSESLLMSGPLGALAQMTYPGRLIILGRDPSKRSNVVIYAITGRSPASRARLLRREENAVWARPAEPLLVQQGNLELLIYPAIVAGRGIAISNGRQTLDIDLQAEDDPVSVLDKGLARWSFEPDDPCFTPRISGCILASDRAALSVIRRSEDGAALRNFFEIPLVAGRASFVATYAGSPRDPLPSFEGEPVALALEWESAASAADAVYESLGPKSGGPDFRVAVACLFARAEDMSQFELRIINRQEGMR
jgi:IMP cyclohydrolase